jgi:hypothetical protein
MGEKHYGHLTLIFIVDAIRAGARRYGCFTEGFDPRDLTEAVRCWRSWPLSDADRKLHHNDISWNHRPTHPLRTIRGSCGRVDSMYGGKIPVC